MNLACIIIPLNLKSLNSIAAAARRLLLISKNMDSDFDGYSHYVDRAAQIARSLYCDEILC